MMTFEEAFDKSKTLKEKPSNDILLQLYSLYKQATLGNAPEKGEYNMFDFIAKAKHEAWLKCKDLEQEEAKTQYVSLVESLTGA